MTSVLQKPGSKSTHVSHSHEKVRHHSHTVLGKGFSKVIPAPPVLGGR